MLVDAGDVQVAEGEREAVGAGGKDGGGGGKEGAIRSVLPSLKWLVACGPQGMHVDGVG
jgi:hypothetical protein